MGFSCESEVIAHILLAIETQPIALLSEQNLSLSF